MAPLSFLEAVFYKVSVRPQPFRRFRVFRGLRSTGFLVLWGLPFRPPLQTTVFVVLSNASGPPADGPHADLNYEIPVLLAHV